jgi:hypothetical protein
VRAAASACLLAFVLALGCGKYGPPVRASETATEAEPFPAEEADAELEAEP